MKLEKTPVYVPVNSQVNSRKRILLIAVDTINLLERYEYLKQIRSKKRASMSRIKTLFEELDNDLDLIKRQLPYIEEKQIEKEEVKLEKRREKSMIETKKLDNYKQLDRELRQIKDKLARLEI